MNEEKPFEVKVLMKSCKSYEEQLQAQSDNAATLPAKSDRERHSNLQFYYFGGRRQDSIP
jgi:hypothetical protein